MSSVAQKVSLTNRVLITSSVALLVALGVIGLVMDQAFKEKTLHLVKERLESYVIAIISNTDVEGESLIFPEYLPSPRMDQPGSGMYAQIVVGDQSWESPSVLGQELPVVNQVATNERAFDAPLEFNGERLFRMRQGFVLNGENGPIEMTLAVTEDAGNFYRELAEFEETLFTWLISISTVLVCVQWVIMYWSTKPLKKLTADLLRLEKGDELIFSENYPIELKGLTTSLNRLIENERNNLSRQRRTLGDLAHSLKTPLAVIHSELENTGDTDKQLIQQQVMSMNEIVAYQLKRAAVAGHRTFVTGVPVIDILDKMINTLQKIHPNRTIKVQTQIAPGAEFYGEKGDLMEVLGNLLENAFKWCDQNIHVLVKTLYMEGRKRTGLVIEIGDDGPGIPARKREQLLQRGVRGDEHVKGHGIGLSIVTDIVESYQGELEIKAHEVLEGACFKVILPP